VIRILRQFVGDDRGTNALELALATPVFVLMIIGIFAFGFVLWVENSIQSAAAQAARCAVVNTTACGSTAQIQNAAVGWALGAPISTANVTVNPNATCNGMTGKSVAITYTATFFVISTTMSAESCYF
jgi:Flp pilus assembly protein TadG